MELTYISFHNYKNHRHRTFKFESGITGIVGDNGKGKTSVISGISFLFTGLVDTDTKHDCITVGETEGWVKGGFRLNGKDGTLERHLNSSKVVLTYDDTTYNKVSEVNALWNDLLKIDSTIFNNVIIAKQGEIQKLFSDESAVREKIFQKIFLVPPTEKIRSLIWDNYIKNCPPEKPNEDIVALQTLQAGVAAERNKLMEQVERMSLALGDPATMKCMAEQIQFLEKCQGDVDRRAELLTQTMNSSDERNLLQTTIIEIERQLAIIDFAARQAEYEKLLMNQKTSEQHKSMSGELQTFMDTIMSDEEFQKLKTEAEGLQKQAQELQTKNIEDVAKLRDLAGKINKFSQLTGHAECPTCNQTLPDIKAFLTELRREETEVKSRSNANNVKATTLGRSLQAVNTKITNHEVYLRRINYLVESIDKLGVVEYSEDRIKEIRKEIEDTGKLQLQLTGLKTKLTKLDGNIELLEEKLANLSTYNGDTTVEEELVMYQTAIAEDNKLRQQVNTMEMDVAKLQHELELYNQRIKVSEQNSEYNLRRKQYIDRLTQVHDVFHVSRFPRKLIETYMDQVQAALSCYMEYFELPYSVQIGDGFKIRLVNSDGYVLPMVSGGQEVMIGICLRLALHKMFAKSFSIWIVDEGTTHLSETKKPQYFALINELRAQRIISQIILVDHDERLGSVVDHTIQL